MTKKRQPYAQAAIEIYESGLGWPLPLPPGKKSTPPPGYTGWEGDEPDDSKVGEWVRSQADGNAAIRLAGDVIGIDVDAYKDGVTDTLAKLEAAHGPLPTTWGSTSRLDGLSGIWLFTISPDAANDAHGIVAPGIEVIRYGHRYVVAPPSAHPSGAEYVWRVGPDPAVGAVAASPPTRETLTRLPDAWVSHVILGDRCPCGVLSDDIPMTFPTQGSWADQYVAPSRVTRQQGKSPEEWHQLAVASLSGSTGSRHDTVLRAAQALVRAAEDGSADAGVLIESLGTEFVASVTGDGSRTQREAESEWRRMLSGAAVNVARSPSPTALVTSSNDDPWEATPVTDFSHMADEPIEWLLKGFLVANTYGVLGGAEKTLKSQIAYHVAMSMASGEPLFGHYEAERPGKVLLYSGEGGRRLLARRFTRLARSYGVSQNVLSDIFVVDRAGRLTDTAFIEAFGRNLARVEPELVILDPAYSYMGGNLEAGNVFEMGEVLSRLTALVQDNSDATLLVTHHATKIASGVKEMNLGSLSQAGFREWVDSWVLLWHREEANVSTGSFKLRAKVGSRQWGENVLDIDYEDGVLDLTTGRFTHDPTWQITDVGHAALTANKGGRPGQSDSQIKEAVISVLSDDAWVHTMKELADAVGGRTETVRETIKQMEADGSIEFAPGKRPNVRGQLRTVKVAGFTKQRFDEWKASGSRALRDALPDTYEDPPEPQEEV